MKVIILRDRVVHMSKRIPKETFSGTYTGITVFSAEANRQLFGRLGQLVSAGRVNEFFNVAVQELADEGLYVGFTSPAGLSAVAYGRSNIVQCQTHVKCVTNFRHHA